MILSVNNLVFVKIFAVKVAVVVLHLRALYKFLVGHAKFIDKELVHGFIQQIGKHKFQKNPANKEEQTDDGKDHARGCHAGHFAAVISFCKNRKYDGKNGGNKSDVKQATADTCKKDRPDSKAKRCDGKAFCVSCGRLRNVTEYVLVKFVLVILRRVLVIVVHKDTPFHLVAFIIAYFLKKCNLYY